MSRPEDTEPGEPTEPKEHEPLRELSDEGPPSADTVPEAAAAQGEREPEPVAPTTAEPASYESPERARRRVAKGGRVGVRFALGALLASLLPAALAAGALVFLPHDELAADASLSGLRARFAVSSLVLALLLGTALALRLRGQLSAPLTALEARLRLLASGHPAPRAELPRPAELSEVEDAADAVERTLVELRQAAEREEARSRRLYALAEVADAAAHGRLEQRAAASDDVAEATLAVALNRLLEGMERQIVRLKSHVEALARGPAADGEEGADGEDSAAVVVRRAHGLRPVPALLLDISGRLGTLARSAPESSKLEADLRKLSEAIGQRGKAALALFDALEAELARLPGGGGGGGEGLTPAQRRALEQLAEDLANLSTSRSLPTLVESLPELGASELAARLAPPPESA